MTFQEVIQILKDKNNWDLRDSFSGLAVYKNKYYTYLKDATHLYAVSPKYPKFLASGGKMIFDFNYFQWLIIALFYRRPLRKYLENRR